MSGILTFTDIQLLCILIT